MNSTAPFENTAEITPEEMLALLEKQKKSFKEEGYVTLESRLQRIDKLEALLRDNVDPLCEAMSEDFGHRSPIQSRVADFFASYESFSFTRKNIKSWMKHEKRNPPLPMWLTGTRAEIHYQPKGVVGNISTWNFPVFVATNPVLAALAAGNRCMVKLTEVTPKTSALMEQLFAQYFDETEVVGINGGPEVGAAFSSLPLDHIIFTGATSIGKYVLQGAANNLTPVTLELGGKSPVYVGRSADLQEAALRIFTGKAMNVGQVCISPDYVFVPKEKLDEFVSLATEHVKSMFPTMVNNPDYSSVINARHHARLISYIEDAREKGADVREINPGNEDFSQQNGTHKIPLTLVVNPGDDLKVMQEEIFGPIVCIKTYDNIDECIDYINDNPRPLAFYPFSKDQNEIDRLLKETCSGGVCVNDVLAHVAIEDVPFGGIGPSGMGNYHGYEGFKTFSHAKSVVKQPRLNMMKYTGMIPPYNDKTQKSLDFMLKK